MTFLLIVFHLILVRWRPSHFNLIIHGANSSSYKASDDTRIRNLMTRISHENNHTKGRHCGIILTTDYGHPMKA